MQFLDQEIAKINSVIGVGLTNAFFCDTVTRITERRAFDNPERVNADANTDPIIFNSDYNYYIYHRLTRINGSGERKSGGKTKRYLNNVSIEMYVYTTDRDYLTCLLSRLNSIKNVDFQEVDFDSYSIIANETSKKDFDPATYIYVVRYNIEYFANCITAICN